jgi:hypothetical protein
MKCSICNCNGDQVQHIMRICLGDRVIFNLDNICHTSCNLYVLNVLKLIKQQWINKIDITSYIDTTVISNYTKQEECIVSITIHHMLYEWRHITYDEREKLLLNTTQMNDMIHEQLNFKI